MFKTTLFSLVAVTGSFVSSAPLFAGQAAACPSSAAPAAAVPANPPAGMPVTQGNRGTTYQSYSYEPGTAPRATSAPAYRTSRQSSLYDTVRGDNKFRSFSGFKK